VIAVGDMPTEHRFGKRVATYELMMNLNLRAAFVMTRAILPGMIRKIEVRL